MFKKEKGITLVALVVTIIILLILAGVALTIALSNNGLFQYARNSAAAYNQAAVKESGELTSATNMLGNLFNEYGLDATE